MIISDAGSLGATASDSPSTALEILELPARNAAARPAAAALLDKTPPSEDAPPLDMESEVAPKVLAAAASDGPNANAVPSDISPAAHAQVRRTFAIENWASEPNASG